MKYSFVLFAASAAAFPGMTIESLSKRMSEEKLQLVEDILVDRQTGIPSTPAAVGVSQKQSNCGPHLCPTFSESDQRVSTTGQYAYKSPAADEIRGPCPGLNAAANHGYLDHSGVSTIGNTIDGLGALYNMSPDLSGFLAAYAIAFDGDIISGTWSIGGPQPANLLGLGILGKPQGISWSHNKYEGDTSIGRQDAYLNNGDAHSLNIGRFRQVYETGMADDRYTLDRFRQDFGKNVQYSIKNNPYYFAPLFSTTLVAPAAYNFVINFMSNHTAKEPAGYLNGQMFKEFFAVSGDYPNFKWLPGQERIPNNWYRRPSYAQYNAVDVFQDLIVGWAAYPDTFRFGGNTNGVNTYTGIDLTNFTGGAYNLKNLLDKNNFMCFFFQNQQQAVPDVLKGGVNAIAGSLDLINKYQNPIFGKLGCPALGKYDSSVFNKYPGHTYSPTGPATNY